MRGSNLTFEQLRLLKLEIVPRLAYLQRVRARMIACKFEAGDRMFRDIELAEVALRDLVAEIDREYWRKNRVEGPFR